MAIDQTEAGHYDPADASRGGVASILATTFWAVASLGVFVGALVWAYGLGVRNPADVPALKAAAEGYKQRPADPGGLRVPDQSRRIYSTVAGAAPQPVEQARPSDAPERPTAEDLAVAAKEVGSDAFVAIVADAMNKKDPAVQKKVVNLDYYDIRPGSTQALAPQPPAYPANVGRGAEKLPKNAAGADARVTVSTPSAAETAAKTAAKTGAAKTATAETRPADRLASASAAATAEPSPAAAETPPENDAAAAAEVSSVGATAKPQAASGGVALEAPAEAPKPQAAKPAKPAAPASNDGRVYQVQLAALESVPDVKQRWEQIRRRQSDLVGDLALDIQSVNVGGAELFRLRLDGVGARENAAKLCSELRKRGVDCFVAVKR